MRSYIEIDSRQLIINYKAFKLQAPHTAIFAVVKGNGYGHGLKELTTILEHTVDGFCVEDAYELEQLRKITRKYCLVLGHVTADEVRKENISQTVFSLFSWEQIPLFRTMSQKFGIKIPVHIKSDVLLGRQGFLNEELGTLCDILKRTPFIDVQGIYGHLSAVKSGNNVHSRKQHELFRETINSVQSSLGKKLLTHMDATGGLVFHQSTYAAARLGAGLYGIWPVSEELKKVHHLLPVKPVLRWVSGITHIKLVPAGYPIGYDKTFVTTYPMKIAVVPQGYADGYDRQLSNNGYVLVKGKRCNVIGRVSMNVMVVDVTHIGDAMVGDEVVLLGRQGNAEIFAHEVGQKADTIAYEIVTRISPLLERVVK